MRVVWLGWTYVWRVLVNIIALLVVWYVFGRLYERTDTIIVALVGLLYVSMRGIAVMQMIGIVKLIQPLQRTVALHVARIDRDLEERELVEAYDKEDRDLVHVYAKMFINSLFLGLISLICLWRFFTVL